MALVQLCSGSVRYLTPAPIAREKNWSVPMINFCLLRSTISLNVKSAALTSVCDRENETRLVRIRVRFFL